MTPDELENRLAGLGTPDPSPRLRDRLLHPPLPAPERRWAGMAMAASIMAAALIFWIVWRMAPAEVTTLASQDTEAGRLVEKLGHEDPAERDKATARLIELGETAEASVRAAENHKDPEIATRARKISGILVRGKRFGKITPDRDLQEKLERILKANPDEAVYVTRVTDRRGDTPRPMTTPALRQTLSLEQVEERRSMVEGTALDTDGYFFFIVPRGKLRINGFNMKCSPELGEFFHIWEGYAGDHSVTEALILPEQSLVRNMRWTSPSDGDLLSIKKNPDITWEDYPGVVKAVISLIHYVRERDGGSSTNVGRVEVDCAKGGRVPLATLLKSVRNPLGAGSTIGMQIQGYGADGKLLSGITAVRRFDLED